MPHGVLALMPQLGAQQVVQSSTSQGLQVLAPQVVHSTAATREGLQVLVQSPVDFPQTGLASTGMVSMYEQPVAQHVPVVIMQGQASYTPSAASTGVMSNKWRNSIGTH